jgi:DNA-binding CsgD family transcriptional regulator
MGVTLFLFIIKNYVSHYNFRLIAAIFGVATLIVALLTNLVIFYKIKSKIATYYLLGSTLFLVAVSMAFYLTVQRDYSSLIEPINYMQLGAIFEIFMFSLIIAHKIKLDKEKKEELEMLYAHKLNEINVLKEKIAYNLELKRTENKPILLEDLNSLSNNKLTKREFEILKQVSEGYNNKEIADQSFISLNTVKFHLKNIFDKLDVNNRIQASQYFNKF